MIILRLYRKTKVFCLEVIVSLEENFSEEFKYIAD